MKKCTKCKSNKSPDRFGKDAKRADGLNPWCKDCCAQYYVANRERITKRAGEYRKRTADIRKERQMQYARTHGVEKAMYDVAYRKKNADKIREYKREWERKNRNNPIFKIKRALRRRMHHAIADGYKSASSVELLGCSVEEFKKHLEAQFLPGMTWDNYGIGGWHIDHIRPCCNFDLTKESEQRACFNFRNCQPLWEADNLKKAYIHDGINCRIKP